MIKLTQNWDGVESDCFIKTTGIVSVSRSPANGLTMVFFESAVFTTNIVQTPSRVMALIEEERRQLTAWKGRGWDEQAD